LDQPISTVIAATPAKLATWLRVFRVGDYGDEALTTDTGTTALLAAAAQGEKVFITASYERSPSARRGGLHAGTAELETVVIAPLWHSMGLEVALITASVRAALARGSHTIFVVAPPGEVTSMYHRLGFVGVTRILTFWLAEDYATIRARQCHPCTRKRRDNP